MEVTNILFDQGRTGRRNVQRAMWVVPSGKNSSQGHRHVNGAAEQLHVSHVGGRHRKSLIHSIASSKSEAFGFLTKTQLGLTANCL